MAFRPDRPSRQRCREVGEGAALTTPRAKGVPCACFTSLTCTSARVSASFPCWRTSATSWSRSWACWPPTEPTRFWWRATSMTSRSPRPTRSGSWTGSSRRWRPPASPPSSSPATTTRPSAWPTPRACCRRMACTWHPSTTAASSRSAWVTSMARWTCGRSPSSVLPRCATSWRGPRRPTTPAPCASSWTRWTWTRRSATSPWCTSLSPLRESVPTAPTPSCPLAASTTSTWTSSTRSSTSPVGTYTVPSASGATPRAIRGPSSSTRPPRCTTARARCA